MIESYPPPRPWEAGEQRAGGQTGRRFLERLYARYERYDQRSVKCRAVAGRGTRVAVLAMPGSAHVQSISLGHDQQPLCSQTPAPRLIEFSSGKRGLARMPAACVSDGGRAEEKKNLQPSSCRQAV